MASEKLFELAKTINRSNSNTPPLNGLPVKSKSMLFEKSGLRTNSPLSGSSSQRTLPPIRSKSENFDTDISQILIPKITSNPNLRASAEAMFSFMSADDSRSVNSCSAAREPEATPPLRPISEGLRRGIASVRADRWDIEYIVGSASDINSRSPLQHSLSRTALRNERILPEGYFDMRAGRPVIDMSASAACPRIPTSSPRPVTLNLNEGGSGSSNLYHRRMQTNSHK